MPSPLALRVLAAAPRPTGLAFAADHSLLGALYDALEAQGDQVEGQILWPPTSEALQERLASQDLPAIDIVYLEGVASQEHGTARFCFEGEDGQLHGLDAAALAGLLAVGHVSLLLLNAHVRKVAEASELFARELADTGGLCVVLLDHRLAQETASQALTAFFAALLAGHTLGQAVLQARQGAGAESRLRRFALGTSEIAPSVPMRLYGDAGHVLLASVMASASPGMSKIVHFPSPSLSPAWQRLAVAPDPGGLPAEPSHGFVRRAELEALERALRDDRVERPLWVYGHVGLGKTSMLAQAGRWLVRTGRFEQAVYTSFAGGGLPESALYDLGARLIGQDFALASGDATQTIERALIEAPTLVIWDNVEALLAEGEFALGAEPLAELWGLAARLGQAGRSRLCILSDTPSLPSQASSLAPLSLALGVTGLREEEALTLLDRLLPIGPSTTPAPESARELVTVLGGHPLALCILTAVMRQRPLAEIMTQLEEMLPGLRTGEARLGNQALDLALAYLMRSFPEDSRLKLPAVGLYAGGFMEALARPIIGLEEATWEECKKRLIPTQTLLPERLAGLNVPYIRLHPALGRFMARRLSTQQGAGQRKSYCESYAGLLRWLEQTEGRSRVVVTALARRELPNFRRSLHLMLADQQLSLASVYGRSFRHILEGLGLAAERDAISGQVDRAAAQAVPKTGPLGRTGVQFLLSQSEQLLSSGRVAEGGALLQQLCQRILKEDGLSYEGELASFDRGVAVHRLARVLQSVGRMDGALPAYAQALQLLKGTGERAEVRREILSVHADLGEALLITAQLDKAQEVCQTGLEMATELQDKKAMGALTAKLGAVAVARQQPELARQHFENALELMSATDDPASTARIWDQLGMLAWQFQGDLAEAERCFDQVVQLSQGANQFMLQAQALTQLAQVAQSSGRPDDAETRYTQALSIYREQNIRPAVVSTEATLAEMLLRQGDLLKAGAHAEAARVVAEGIGAESRPWEVYLLLRRIAQAEGNEGKVKRWHVRAQESFAGSTEAEQVRQRWQTLIQTVARSCRGEALDLETVELVEKLETTAEWQGLAQTIWRVLRGERGPQLHGDLDLVDATVVKSILQAIEAPEETDEESS